MPEGGERFDKSLRLRRRSEFLLVQDRGFKVSCEPLLALALPNGLAHPRLGVTVSSKVGNAVVRAKLKRRLRELFRKKRSLLPPGMDLVLVARNSAKDADHAALARAFEQLAERLRQRFSP